MNGFIDIHTHILPGVDDGARDMQEALEMVRMAWQDGTAALVLTPHCRGDYQEHSPQWLQETFSILCALVAEEIPDMQLYLGSEIRFESDVPEKLLEKKRLSLNDSSYALLEFGRQALRSLILRGVSEAIRYGFTPVIAHAERCDTFRTHPELADEVRAMGACIQINADSVLGARGFSVKRYCHKLLKARLVQFVASDAHDRQSRPPLLKKCFMRISKKYGQDYAAQVFYENAYRIIEKESR